MAELDELLAGSQPHLANVHPELAKRVINMITLACQAGLNFGAFMGLRTWEEQDALYAEGRTAPGNIVTKAKGGQSSHNFGLAVDLVEDGDPNQAGIQWSWKNNVDYLKLGAIAKQANLEWAGFWKSFKDYPHVSLTLGLTMPQAQLIYQVKGGMPAVWAEIDRRLAANMPLGSGW